MSSKSSPSQILWIMSFVVGLIPVVLGHSMSMAFDCYEIGIDMSPQEYFEEKGFTIEEGIEKCLYLDKVMRAGSFVFGIVMFFAIANSFGLYSIANIIGKKRHADISNFLRRVLPNKMSSIMLLVSSLLTVVMILAMISVSSSLNLAELGAGLFIIIMVWIPAIVTARLRKNQTLWEKGK